MNRSDYLNDLRKKVRQIRNDVQKDFYFLESSDLRNRPAEGKWNIIEVFDHVNIYQNHYAKSIAQGLEKAPASSDDSVKLSWMGKRFIKMMEPQNGEIKRKMKTFKKTDPILRAKEGFAIDEKVVFQNFIKDIEFLEELILEAYDKDISKIKVPTFIPIIKINIADAFGFNLAHTERHMLQARRILK